MQPIDSPERHISHGFYRVSDREAAQLARGVGKPLPKHGYELRVELSDGRLAWLSRTPTQYSLREGPARGWVWAVSGIGERRSNPTGAYALDNPGPHYSRRGRVITFDNGHRYVINEATVRQAARYLAHDVKIAEHAGRRPPTGPQGLTPGAAAVLIHFGRKLLPRKPRRRPTTRPSAPRTRPAQVRLPAPAPAVAPIPDFWDRTAEIYGGL